MRTFNFIAVLSILSLALVGCASTFGTSPRGLEVPIESAAIRFAADIKDGGYKIVSTDELKKWLDERKEITIISTLPAADDKELGVLPSGVNGVMPKTEKELTQSAKESLIRTAGVDKEKTIVVYCGFVACRRSHIGAKILVEDGFKNVYRYPAGITGWQQMGYPISK